MFSTRCYPCFNEHHQLFYPEGKKVVPQNIGELLTPAGLAYWAHDDGGKRGSGFALCTHSFTLSEVELLVLVLKQKFNLDCTIQKVNKNKEQYRIYIKSNSIALFRELVTPYFHDSIKYKLN